MGEEKKEGKKKIIINQKLIGKIIMNKKEGGKQTYHNVGVSNVSACMGSS